ncbi:MAG: HAMP domain-containing histidine kinase [Candidatus Eisenbacteria bacterium]|nr:HAMP domain-containing histidine kinase [Candidatus Eisenbacteria bacterium]
MAETEYLDFLGEENPTALRKHILGLETLLDLTRSLMVIQDRRTLDGFLLLTAMGLLSVSRAILLAPDGSEDRFHLHVRGLREKEIRSALGLRPSGVFARRMRVASGIVEVRADGLSKRESGDIELLRSNGIRYAVPIRVKDRLNGILLLGERVHGEKLSPFENRMLRSILDIAGVVMDNTELYDDLRSANRAMEAQNERLKELDRLKTEFLSNVGHELRTPITSVIGFAECLRYPEIDEATRMEFAGHILEQGQRLSNLIDQVLDLSEITEQTLRVEPREADLNELVREVADSLRREIEAKNLSIELDLSPDLPPSRFDPKRTKRVVRNLLDNAIKFSHAKGRVRISSEVMDGTVALRVSDEGVGIPQGSLDSIFDSFRQVDGSETRVHGGAGVGLALVKEIMESQNGSVSVESTPGKGSTFTIQLPRSEENQIPETPPAR